jgi:hypothetical protein
VRAALVLAILLAGSLPGSAQAPALSGNNPGEQAAFQAQKCQRYREAWSYAVRRRGTEGLSPEFVERHEAFLANGCVTSTKVCPRVKAEFDMANMLVMLGMNAGMSSTFFPFSCAP